MTREEILDGLLLPLAGVFESGNRLVVGPGVQFAEEFEAVRECLAVLEAEGSVTNVEKMGFYRFTPEGYSKFKPRIDALRALLRGGKPN